MTDFRTRGKGQGRKVFPISRGRMLWEPRPNSRLSPNLRSEIKGARIAQRDPVTRAYWAWFGGHYIHAYDTERREIALFSIGSYDSDNASEEDVRKAIESKVRRGWRGLAESAVTEGDYDRFISRAHRRKGRYQVIYERDGVRTVLDSNLTLSQAKDAEARALENIAYGEVTITKERRG